MDYTTSYHYTPNTCSLHHRHALSFSLPLSFYTATAHCTFLHLLHLSLCSLLHTLSTATTPAYFAPLCTACLPAILPLTTTLSPTHYCTHTPPTRVFISAYCTCLTHTHHTTSRTLSLHTTLTPLSCCHCTLHLTYLLHLFLPLLSSLTAHCLPHTPHTLMVWTGRGAHHPLSPSPHGFGF